MGKSGIARRANELLFHAVNASGLGIMFCSLSALVSVP
jgi:hypothetical protein